MRTIITICIAVAMLLSMVSCGGGEADEKTAIKDTIKGYVVTFNAEDFDKCLTYFTGYEDREDSLAFLSFTRNLSGELELKKIEDITIIPVAVPGGSRTATATVIFTILGEEGIDQMQLEELDGKWKIVWEQEQSLGTYQLTHNPEDAEYILSWDEIVSRCPDIGEYDKQEVFIRRGESKQISPAETSSMGMDSPMAWSSLRSVFAQKAPAGESFRGFGVYITYCETDEYLDEYIELMKTQGLPLREDGDFVTAVLESGPPIQSVQIHLAGNQFYILFLATASSDESLFFSKEKLMELLPTVKSKISSLEITPLPSDIPERKLMEDGELHEGIITVRSKELPLAVRVPEEEIYNDLWFEERPLMQVFNFVIDKDWRFIMAATGEIGTKFEVYITVSSPGEQGSSYSSDQVFSLYSETVTFAKEQTLEEGYVPPVNVEIKVFFNLPMSWVITIEK